MTDCITHRTGCHGVAVFTFIAVFFYSTVRHTGVRTQRGGVYMVKLFNWQATSFLSGLVVEQKQKYYKFNKIKKGHYQENGKQELRV